MVFITNSDKVKQLKDRVIHVKQIIPNLTPTLFLKRFPRYKSQYHKVINVLNIKSTDLTMTKKLELMLKEYESENKKSA